MFHIDITSFIIKLVIIFVSIILCSAGVTMFAIEKKRKAMIFSIAMGLLMIALLVFNVIVLFSN